MSKIRGFVGHVFVLHSNFGGETQDTQVWGEIRDRRQKFLTKLKLEST